MPPGLDDAGIRLYLLGLLPEVAAETLEEGYLGQPDVLDRVRAVENDLLDDYAAGRLVPDEKTAFEARYLASPRLRERVLAARALRLGVTGTATGAVAPVGRSRSARWAGLALAAGLLLGTWLVYRLSRPTAPPGASPPLAERIPASSPTARTPPPGSDAPPPEPRPSLVAEAPVSPAPSSAPLVLALSPVLLRAEGPPPELAVPAGTGAIVLELERDPAMAPSGARRLEAVIATVEGARVWSGVARRHREAGRPLLQASVAPPPDRLVPGDYVLTLSAANETLARYFFRVSAR